MRRLLFLLVLIAYGSDAMELDVWSRIPGTALHFLEHHSDLGHHDTPAQDCGGHDHDSSPFGDSHPEALCCCHIPALTSSSAELMMILPAHGITLGSVRSAACLSAVSGAKWNPPKLA